MENNWIENVSGECPVEKGTLIDVQFRDGEVMLSIPALESIVGESYEATYPFWMIDDVGNDIVLWRLHKPEQSLDDALGSTTVPLAGTTVGAFKPPPEYVYPQTTFKPSSETQLRSDEAARVNTLLSEKLSTISDIASKLTRKNFSVADIKLVKDLLESVKEYEENR